jgi:hypothetical protein
MSSANVLRPKGYRVGAEPTDSRKCQEVVFMEEVVAALQREARRRRHVAAHPPNLVEMLLRK